MNVESGPRCNKCNEQMVYQGRTSRPVETIYRCNRCGVEVWQDDEPVLAEIKIEPQAA
jgi:DNA-directed RNA polymerase subunit RPC12/RpoP